MCMDNNPDDNNGAPNGLTRGQMLLAPFMWLWGEFEMDGHLKWFQLPGDQNG